MIKTKSGLGKIVLTAVLAVLFFTAVTAVASATTIYVPEGGNQTIQAAVNNASSGGVIIVRDAYTGTKENIDVNKAHLTIRSENGTENCIVNASSSCDHVFNVTADYVNISGFTVENATIEDNVGIYLYGREHCNISDNNVTNNYDGIYLSHSNNNTLTNNTANSNNEYGIYLTDLSNNNTLTDNTANSNDCHGIFLTDSSNNNTLTNNTANSNNEYGISLYDYSSYNTLTNNTAYNNTQHGIYLLSSSYNNLTNNTASNNTQNGIFLTDSSNYNTLTNNTASNNTLWDFYSTEDSHDNTIEDLTIASYPTTISFAYDQGIKIKGVTTPKSNPDGKRNVSKYVNATNVTADSWLFLNVSYTDANVSDSGVEEGSLLLYRWNETASAWELANATGQPNGVNTTGNYVYANVTSFSQIAPFGNPPDTTPPGNVTGFTAAAGDGQVSLSWTNPGDADFIGTNVIRKQDSYPVNVSDGTEVCNRTKAPGSTDSYTDTGLTNGIAYYYTAFAYDEVPNYSSADDSARDCATPTAPPPAVPVPEFNAIGLLALVGILSVVLAVATLKKRK